MKKRFVFAMAAVALLFTACNKDVETNVANDEGAVQRISLAVENAGSNTRAGRELLSSEAKQSIENVKVIIVNDANEIIKVNTITDWNTTASVYTDGGHGKKKEWVLEGDERLDAGDYTIYGFGYSNGSLYDATATVDDKLATKLAALAVTTPKTTYTGDMLLTTDGATYGEEIFAGKLSFNVASDKETIKETLVLHRQVAGAFAYVKEIPYVADAKYLRLYAAQNNTGLVLGDFAPVSPAELANNGTLAQNNKVINGTAGAGVQTMVLQADLNDWFTAIAADANNLIDATNWIAAGHANFNNGSVFMGKFLIPFENTAAATFVLKLEKNDGTALRTWNIKLQAAEVLNSETIRRWTGTTFADETGYTESATNYSIFRNHLYGIGSKATDTNVPATDDPQTLNTKQTLTLKVNDNWEVIHTMLVD